MPCFYPLQAFRLASGAVEFVERGDVVATLSLPCGRCLGCRLERARQWQLRVMHEASQWKRSCFVTLTYSDERLPAHGCLQYPDFQRFMKRLRRVRGATRASPIRFYMCGEYGEELGRPHYHAALFNEDFSGDRKVWRDFGSGNVVYRSPLLERLWPFGMSSVGELTHQSAAYIARYVMKKVTGEAADRHYQVVDTESGELAWKPPEFTHMSLKPGIGALWFEKYAHTDVYPHDRVVSRGKESKPPRYYDQLLKRSDPATLEAIKLEREARARSHWQDSTPERLAVREQVTAARIRTFRRKLK